MRDLHASQIKAAVEAVKARKEVNEVYFVACGGSQAVLMAGQYMFDKESSIPSHVYTANEFVYDTPKRLNENSVVISCSHSGNTPETVEATKLARSKGALTICLSNLEGSPLWEAAEYPVHYDWGKEVSDSDQRLRCIYLFPGKSGVHHTKYYMCDLCAACAASFLTLPSEQEQNRKEKYPSGPEKTSGD